MPLFELDLDERYREKQTEISSALHAAMVTGLGAPITDKFQVFRYHDPSELVFDHTHGGVDRRDILVIRLSMTPKYDLAAKNRFFRALAQEMEAIGIRHEDLFVLIFEFAFDDVYPGKVRGNGFQ